MIKQIGVDIIENSRFESFLDEPRKIKKILSSKEIEVYHQIVHGMRKLEYLASRFAAKEALTKAGFSFTFAEVSILNHEDGRPFVSWDKTETVFISLSHNNSMSIAFVVVESS